MSSRNSPTLTLDVRARRAERLAAWLVLVAAGVLAVALLGRLSSCDTTRSPSAAVGCRRVRAVARRLDRVQASDRRACDVGLPGELVCRHACGARCRVAALDGPVPVRRRSMLLVHGDHACRAAARAVRAPADRGSGAGVARSPVTPMRTVRERALAEPRKCAVVPRTFRGAASLSEQPAEAAGR